MYNLLIYKCLQKLQLPENEGVRINDVIAEMLEQHLPEELRGYAKMIKKGQPCVDAKVSDEEFLVSKDSHCFKAAMPILL